MLFSKIKTTKLYKTLRNLYLSTLSDEEYFMRCHKRGFGTTPDFKNPQTFNEKIVHRILYDRNPVYTLLADKLKARIYIASKLLNPSSTINKDFLEQTGGSENVLQKGMPIYKPISEIKDLLFATNLCEHLPKLYGIWDSVDQIDFASLPNSFVLKTNHDGGGVVIVKDKNVFLSDSKFFKSSMKKLAEHLKANWYSMYREYHYKDIEPKVFAEELLDSELHDIRFHQFFGKTELIQVANHSHTHNDLYSKCWEKLNIAYLNTPSNKPLNKPRDLDNMLKFAYYLSKDINYIRIDQFVANNQFYIGELTLTPNGGMGKFFPASFDYELGSFFVICPQ